jgi:DNA segregation ATPase FtsK/SpoIIIE-like protein
VITGLIKANIPTRISFMVSSAVDSRTIIDMGGAERLLGRGDMLYLPADAGRPERIQGAFLSDEEANTLADYWHRQIIEHAAIIGEEPAHAQPELAVEPGWELKDRPAEGFELEDDLLDRAEEIVRENGRASISLLQRRLRVGYSRAARLIDLLEQRGIIGQSESGGRGREVYDSGHANGYAHQGSGEGHSMADEVADIMAEERARDEFLRKQAARFQQEPDQI